ncbi:SDR family NAD(P)-dependent oxidoreductase [Archangium sp.]|uniref:SDR family NAD(P)-dependent oxidoreductase n=1 Tax=Archangium sp. TaxID=1872627 RepID=UPI002D2760D8|nr:SDR family NAD(P)-dependent oxidoreductase [Archangium sp.]HYO54689.1 SDR family NAD(P)-dependent oxidoreductase [Archangium sp.]
MGAFSHFVDCLRFRAHEQGARTAFIYLQEGGTERTEWTYARLDEEARRIAGHLLARGAAGDRVLLLHPPGPEFIAAFFGCLYAGRVAVPVPLPASPRKLLSVLPVCEDAQPSTVLSTEGLSMFLQEPLQTRLGPEVAWLNQEALSPEAASAWTPPSLQPDSLAFLQYTSGSTGARRGVRVGHGNLIHNSEVIRRAFGHSAESRGVVWLPHFHDMGLIGGILQPIYCGFPVVLLSPLSFIQRPALWLQAISDFHATTSGGPNFAYELVCDQVTEEQRARLELSSWDVAFTGAEPVRSRTLDRFTTLFQPQGFRRSAFLPCYGLAEATLFVTGTPKQAPPRVESVDAEALKGHHAVPLAPEEPAARPLVGCGDPGLEMRVEIMDPETRVPCPPGTVGELWVSGPSVAQGYWRRPEETQRTFQARPADGAPGTFLRTGDLGFVLEGEFFITGRHRELIILQGRNHYPQDIEATTTAASPLLRPHGAIAFSVERDTGEVLVIVQEVRRKAEEPQRALAAIRRAVAEEHGVEPWAVILVSPGSLPRTTSGKLQRTACRAGYLEGRLSAVASWHFGAPLPGSTPSPGPQPQALPPGVEDIERWIREHMAARLGKPLESITAREPFSSQGLGSVNAVGMAGELQAWLGLPLPPTLLYEHPTPRDLALFLAGVKHAPEGVRAATPRESSHEPIALVGIGCRFPGASGPEAFWRLLQEGRDAVRPGIFPPSPEALGDRTWPGGYLDDVEGFDAGFFGISPREAVSMDPQHRLLLEVGREALEHAAQPIEALRGSATGVFIGISGNEYGQLQAARGGTSPYLTTGNALSIAAARLSYFFDFHGPSLALDTACSSSLVAIHEACESLRRGECDLALAGGVNLMLNPEVTASFLQAGMLSPEGQCKTFDAEAQGYVRGEGCGLVVLKRLPEALAAGDPIIAVLRGSAINQDGHSNGLTAPNGQAQEAVIRRALAAAGVEPSAIGYVEAHGTGTSLGDPIEARAFTRVLGEGRAPGEHCWVGSVKTNIGHLEAAAGVAGLIKTALALQHEEVPAHLHFTRLNPHVPFEGTPFAVATAARRWPRGAARRLAGVSAFGFGGTNAHVVLEEAPPRPRPPERPERPLHLLTLSAREESALRERLERFAQRLSGPDAPSLADLAFTANTCGPHLEHRVALVAASELDAAQGLRQLQRQGPPPRADTRPYVVWRLGDPGAMGVGTGRALRESLPLFRDVLERCDQLLRPSLGWSLLDALEAGPGALDGPRAGPVSVALQLALIDVWKAWGITPDAVAAWGWGECAAGYAAGTLGLEDSLARVAARARSGSDAATRAGPGDAPLEPVKGEPQRPWVILDLMPGVEPELPPVAPPPGRAHVRVTSLAPGRPEWETLLESLAALYLHGARVDWARFDEAWERRRVPLPPYPFQRQRYWVDASPLPAPRGGGSEHPLLGPALGIAGAREMRFERQLDLDEPLRLSEHTVGGQSLLPAAAFCEMALAAGRHAFQQPVVLRDLHLSRPLSLEPGARRRVQTVVTLSGEREARFQLLSAPAGQDPLRAEWTVHCTAALSVDASVSPEAPAALEEGSRVDVDGLYRDLEGRGLHYGPSFRTLRGLTVGGATVVGHVELASESQGPGWLLHPTLLDGCFHALSALPGAAKDTSAYLPVGIESLRLHRPGVTALSCVATVRGAAAEDGSLTADLLLVQEGRRVAEVRGLRLVRRRLHPDWLYRIDWRPQALARRQEVSISQPPGTLPGERVDEAPWLILEDADGVGRALAQRLEATGRRVVRVKPPGPEVLRGHEAEAPGELAAYRELLGDGAWEGVVFLSGLDAPGASRVPVEELPRATARACQVTLGGIQALARMGSRPRAGVWIVTRNAVSGRDAEAVEGLAQAPLWGLGRTVCLEHPDLRCHLVDLEAVSLEQQADQLVAELVANGREEQLLFREGERFVARLVHAPPLPPARGRLSTEGTYLVTGAFGGLGRRVSRWLVELGARALVLLGRGEPSTEAQAEIEALRRAGVSVAVARADVSELPELRRALTAASEGLPPLRGIIHCAGLLEDGALERMPWARFEHVLAPKVQGAWNLHALTRESPLELFVLFSSAASLLGSPGQVNYTAANAFLDALAHYRRGLGLPAQSINWGPWSEVGAAALAGRGARLSQYGLESIAPAEGRRLFEALLSGGGVQVGVLPIDWERLRRFPAGAARPLIEDFLQRPLAAPEQPVAPPPATTAPAPLPAEGPERLAFIEEFLLQRVRRALQIGAQPLDVHTPLGDLGMDSISAIDIEHDIETGFGIQVPLTSLLEGLDIAGLALAVESRLSESTPAKASDGAPPPLDEAGEAARLLGQLDELTDAQVEALLASHSAQEGQPS